MQLVRNSYKFKKREILVISKMETTVKAEIEYEKYRVIQDREYLSDFDRLLLDMEKR